MNPPKKHKPHSAQSSNSRSSNNQKYALWILLFGFLLFIFMLLNRIFFGKTQKGPPIPNKLSEDTIDTTVSISKLTNISPEYMKPAVSAVEIFVQEKTSIEISSIREEYQRNVRWVHANNLQVYYQDINRYQQPIQQALKESIKPYTNFLPYVSSFRIVPTQLDAYLHGGDAFTAFDIRTIFIKLSTIQHEPSMVLPIVANEVQHLLVIAANEKRLERAYNDDAEIFSSPFLNLDEQQNYIAQVEKALKQLASMNKLSSYLTPPSGPFMSYYLSLAGYDVEISKYLRQHALEHDLFAPVFKNKKEVLRYRNTYAKRWSGHMQLFELHTDVASIYSLLHDNDKNVLQPWYNYIHQYVNKPASREKEEISLSPQYQSRNQQKIK